MPLGLKGTIAEAATRLCVAPVHAHLQPTNNLNVSLSQVWNAVDTHSRKSYTSIIHGKWAHEETIATASFAGTYLVLCPFCTMNPGEQPPFGLVAVLPQAAASTLASHLPWVVCSVQVVKDLKEAQFVADYILQGGACPVLDSNSRSRSEPRTLHGAPAASASRDSFFAKFPKQAMSAGFDPDRDLIRVGIANQTTASALQRMWQGPLRAQRPLLTH